jgi:hypothetical protein
MVEQWSGLDGAQSIDRHCELDVDRICGTLVNID